MLEKHFRFGFFLKCNFDEGAFLQKNIKICTDETEQIVAFHTIQNIYFSFAAAVSYTGQHELPVS